MIGEDLKSMNESYKMMSALLFFMVLSPASSQDVMIAAGLTEDERKMLTDFQVGVTKAFDGGKESVGESLDNLTHQLRQVSCERGSDVCGEESINKLQVIIAGKVLGNKDLLQMMKQKSVESSKVKAQAPFAVTKPQPVEAQIKILPQLERLERSEPVSSPVVPQKLEEAKTPALPPKQPAPIEEHLPPSKPQPN